MADRNSLRAVGLMFAALVAAVVSAAGWTVSAHLAGQISFEQADRVTEMSGAAVRH
jgi:hypothetical protein